MKNQKAIQRHKERLFERWSEEDYPGGTPRFQLRLLVKDAAVFCLMPLAAIVIYKTIEASVSANSRPTERRKSEAKNDGTQNNSQIIQFGSSRSGGSGGKLGFAKKSPGTLVKVRLMNVVETFSTAPVHAQIIDAGLGREFIGGTIVGDANPEPGSGRIKIDFKFVRHPRRTDLAVPINARAMSLDGTFGVAALKKEGFFARAATRSAATNNNSIDTGADKEDFKTLVARAVAAGLVDEFRSEASVAHNNAQVLTLKPMTEFYVELTDYFPGQM